MPLASQAMAGDDGADAAVGQGEDHALQDAQHAEGQDERRDFEPVDQLAIDEADQGRRGDHARDDQRGELGTRLHQQAGDDGDQPDELADGEIDEAAGNDEGLADGEDGERRRLVEHVEEVARIAEPRHRREADAEQRQQPEMDFRALRQGCSNALRNAHCIGSG